MAPRTAIPDPATKDDRREGQGWPAALRSLAAALERGGVATAIVLSYEERTRTENAVWDGLREALADGGITVLFEATIRDGHGWIRPHGEEGGRGFVIPDSSRVGAVAHYVAEGVAPLPHRHAVTELVGEDPVDAAAVATVLGGLPGGVGPRRGADWRRLLGADSQWDPTPDDAAGLALSLVDHDWRDGIIATLSPDVLPPETLDPALVRALRRAFPARMPRATSYELIGRMTRLCRMMPDAAGPPTAEVLVLTATLAWHHGEGALAGDACSRALRVCPQHRLAGLLGQLLSAGIAPPQADGGRTRRRRREAGGGGELASA